MDVSKEFNPKVFALPMGHKRKQEKNVQFLAVRKTP
jgi:hypothetical protein